MIIAFSGRKFSGKDSTAAGLIRFHGFKRIGLADKLKDICSEVFSVPREDMDNPLKKENAFQVPICITVENIQDLLDIIKNDGIVQTEFERHCISICKIFVGRNLTSIRDMLQTVGTDVCRNFIQDDIWLCYIKYNISNDFVNTVITDARFKNERDYLKQLGAVLVLVKRDTPDTLPDTQLHISENQLGSDEDYDVIVHNNDTLVSLQSDIAMWYTLRKNAITSNTKRSK